MMRCMFEVEACSKVGSDVRYAVLSPDLPGVMPNYIFFVSLMSLSINYFSL